MIKNASIIVLVVAILISCKSQKEESITEKTPWGEQSFLIPSFKDIEFNILDYGAKTDTTFNNQKSIQEAIDKCNSTGGGRVIIPEGIWKTSYIELKSNVNLYLEKGSTLSFIDSIPLYAVPTFTRWEGLECMNFHPLIYAKDQENIAITGEGTIKGNGAKWWKHARGTQKISLKKLYDLVEAGVEPEKRNCLAFEPTSYLRPSMVQFINCNKILVDGIELHSGPMWTTHFVYCTNLIARNLTVLTVGGNNDGIVPDACNGVLIDKCYFSTGDDCVVIKSGLNEDGWRVGKASENIIIKNCKTNHGHGGVVIGSEMSGGVRNVYAHDCDFSNTDRGLRIKSMKGRGGVIENLWFENIRMDSIKKEAIKINMHYGSSSIEPRSDSLPTFHNFYYKNIHSTNSEFAVRIQGIEGHPVENIFFENLNLKSKNGIAIENADNVHFDKLISVATQDEPHNIRHSKDIVFDSATFITPTDTIRYPNLEINNL